MNLQKNMEKVFQKEICNIFVNFILLFQMSRLSGNVYVGEYSDEGKSGKSVEGRPQFKQMLVDIESSKDNVD